jgi:hypothetical protein
VAAPKFYLLDRDRLTNASFYILTASSGTLSGIAAGTTTAGHLFAARYNPSGAGASKLFHVTWLRFVWQTIAGFTSAQEVALAAYKLTSYSAAHTGGNAATPLALAPGYGAAQLTARMASSAELTVGTQTIGSLLARGNFAELAAAATVVKGFVDEQLPLIDDPHPVIVLAANEGILVRNEVAMGAGGTGRLMVQIGGYERAA